MITPFHPSIRRPSRKAIRRDGRKLSRPDKVFAYGMVFKRT